MNQIKVKILVFELDMVERPVYFLFFRVEIQSSGEASVIQNSRMGVYTNTGIFNDRPKYINNDWPEQHLYYLRSRNKGLWMVGPTLGTFDGGLAHR